MIIQLQTLKEIADEDKIAYRTALKRMKEKGAYIGFFVERYGGKAEEEGQESKKKKIRGYLRRKDAIALAYNLLEE